jgi:hypothetical protein
VETREFGGLVVVGVEAGVLREGVLMEDEDEEMGDKLELEESDIEGEARPGDG